MKEHSHKSNGPKSPEKYKRSHERRLLRKARKHAEGQLRLARCEMRTPEEQLAVLAKRPGHSTKEMHRLETLMHRN